MKKMNNKGFAISTLLYGIVIMVFIVIFALMSTLGTTRKNTKNLVSQIEEELNRYTSTNTTMVYDSANPEDKKYIVPSSGWYKIELWGSKYTYFIHSNLSNKGNYSAGNIYLNENDFLYVHLGKKNSTSEEADSYIYLSPDEDSEIMRSYGGISPDDNTYKYNNFYVLGYAGTQGDNDNVSKTFNINYGNYDNTGNPLKSTISPVFYDTLVVPATNEDEGQARISKISDNDQNNPPGRNTNTMLNNVRYIKDCATGNGNTGGYNQENVHWIEIQAIKDGTNLAKQKNINLYSNNNMISHSQTKLSTDGLLEHDKFNFVEGTNNKCIVVDLGREYNLDELAVWHYYYDGRPYYNNNISVSNNNSSWTEIRKTKHTNITTTVSSFTYDYSEKETKLGIRYSSFQPINEIIEGKYYIISMDNPPYNKAITTNNSNLSIAEFKAEESQQWQVSKNNDNTYKITNIVTGKSLENKSGMLVAENKNYNNHQRWNIIKDNYYYTINDANTSPPPSKILNDLTVKFPGTASLLERFKFVKIN